MPPKDAIDPNLVTADILTPPAAEPAAPAVENLAAGVVLQRGAPPPAPAPGSRQEALVSARITKKGHGEVHDGDGGRYDWNDIVVLPRSVGLSLETRGFAEIQE